jgi:hypothetical protein
MEIKMATGVMPVVRLRAPTIFGLVSVNGESVEMLEAIAPRSDWEDGFREGDAVR